MIDCADRMVLAWRFTTRITAEDLAEMLRGAIFRRFGETRAHAQGDRVSQRQRAGIHVASVPAVRASHGAHPLPYAPAESAVEWISRGLLRQLQTGLCVPGGSRHVGSSAAAGAGVDRPLQPGGAAQRLEDAVADRVLCGVVSQKQDTTCPQLNGAVHFCLRYMEGIGRAS